MPSRKPTASPTKRVSSRRVRSFSSSLAFARGVLLAFDMLDGLLEPLDFLDDRVDVVPHGVAVVFQDRTVEEELREEHPEVVDFRGIGLGARGELVSLGLVDLRQQWVV